MQLMCYKFPRFLLYGADVAVRCRDFSSNNGPAAGILVVDLDFFVKQQHKVVHVFNKFFFDLQPKAYIMVAYTGILFALMKN